MSTFLTAHMPTGLVLELKALAKLPRAPSGYLPALAVDYGYAVSTLRNAVSDLRADRRDEQEGGGMAFPVACAAPAHDGLASGEQDSGCTPAAPVTLAPTVHDPRTVAPAAGVALRESAAPAVPSPGLCWARDAMSRGISVEKVLRSAGDRLSWRDRDALRSGVAPAAQREAQNQAPAAQREAQAQVLA